MLLNFSVDNYKIFRNRATLSMEATSDRQHEDELLKSDAIRSRILRSAVIYGANASGKTKFLEAIDLMRNFVIGSSTHAPGIGLNYSPFKYDKESAKKSTSFEMDLIANGVRYVYGFSYNAQSIIEEHLISYPSGRKKVVFERNQKGYRFPSNVRDQVANSKKVRNNVLYLSVAAQFNHFESLQVYTWFLDRLLPVVQSPADYLGHTLIIARNDKNFEKLLMKALHIADFGITKVYDRNNRNGTVNPGTSLEAFVPVIQDIWVEHNVNGKKAELPLVSESAGTRRFLSIIGPAISCLVNGCTLVVDELDMSFHTDVCEWLIGLFNDPSENTKGAQLIFNTHDVELMSQDRMRRDQIWFTIKDWNSYDARITRMSDYKGVRKDLNIRKAYLNGSFGAKPFIEPERLMEWQ